MSVQSVHGQIIPQPGVLSEPKLLDRLNQTLHDLGIEVEHPGPPTVSFSCSPDTFEDVFDTVLDARPAALIPGEVAATTRFTLLQQVHIPERLADLVDDVIVAEPPQLDP